MNAQADTSLPEARANMYAFLSRLLMEPPTQSLVAPLLQQEFVADLASVLGRDATSDLQEYGQLCPEDIEKLVQEYNDLFVVPLGRYVTPYEAVYRDERVTEGKRMKGLLMGVSTVAVQQSYRRANVCIGEDFMELPDHAGAELSFMCFLCRKEAEAFEQGDSLRGSDMHHMQEVFLEEHLRPWIPALCARIVEKAQLPFYKGVAKLMEAFLALEMETGNHKGT